MCTLTSSLLMPVTLMVLCMQIEASPVRVSGHISEDTIWTGGIILSEEKTKRIALSFKVSFPAVSICPPFMIISTELNTENDQAKCVKDFDGQVANKRSVINLGCKRFIEVSSCKENQTTVECSGVTQFQDWKPRNFYLSFGYSCCGQSNLPPTCAGKAMNSNICNTNDRCTKSVKGLSYEVTVSSDHSTQCRTISLQSRTVCSLQYEHTIHPNLHSYDSRAQILESFFHLGPTILEGVTGQSCGTCHQHIIKAVCWGSLPECVPDENRPENERVIPLCQEMCREVTDACIDCFSANEIWMLLHCEYLPKLESEFPCIYQAVDCGLPQNTSNAFPVNWTSTTLWGKAYYKCRERSLNLGSKGISICQYSGKWSQIGDCHEEKSEKPDLPLVVGTSTGASAGGGILLMIGGVLLWKQCKRKRPFDKSLTRQKAHDAFVCYPYTDNEQDFVRDRLCVQLEETAEPPFKLLVHGRDFKAGWDIKHNIVQAVKNSNAAIILMSQNFIDSFWCRDEFEECYIENKKDPAFQILVIMMQPRQNLTNLTAYMTSFFDTKTYLEMDDPNLFTKLEKYLEMIKTGNEKEIDSSDVGIRIDEHQV